MFDYTTEEVNAIKTTGFVVCGFEFVKLRSKQDKNIIGTTYITIMYQEIYSDDTTSDVISVRIQGEELTTLISDNADDYDTMKTFSYNTLKDKLSKTGTII